MAKKKNAGENSEKSAKKQNAVAKWFKDLKLELSKVVWPSGKTVFNNSIVVFATMLGTALLTFGLDKLFLWLFELAIQGKS